jgi:hypothetical protein
MGIWNLHGFFLLEDGIFCCFLMLVAVDVVPGFVWSFGRHMDSERTFYFWDRVLGLWKYSGYVYRYQVYLYVHITQIRIYSLLLLLHLLLGLLLLVLHGELHGLLLEGGLLLSGLLLEGLGSCK